jgi:hypothetical protein
LRYLGAIGNICRHRESFAALSLDLSDRIFQTGNSAGNQYHRGSGLSETFGQSVSYPLAAAGDNGYLAFNGTIWYTHVASFPDFDSLARVF